MDNSSEKNCNQKTFVDFASTERHRGLSLVFIKHDSFQQSKLGQDVELERKHIVLSKSPRDAMQVSALSSHLGLGSELVDWYWDAISVLLVNYGLFLTDLLAKTDNRLRCRKNTGCVTSKTHIPDHLKQSESPNNEHTISLYSPSVAIRFRQIKRYFPSVQPKRIHQVSLQRCSELAQGKPAKP